MLAMVSSPYLASIGWESIFYSSAAVGVVWIVAFTVLITQTPEAHPWISEGERGAIIDSRLQLLEGEEEEGFQTLCEVPWLEFFRDRAFQGTLVSHFCYNYQSYLALSLGPDFFTTKFDVDISKPDSGLGFYACLPYVCLFVTSCLSGVIADYMCSMGWSLIHVRKIMNSVGLLSCALFYGLLGAPFVQDSGSGHGSLMQAVALLTLGVALGGFAPAGYWSNYHDLSARYGPHLLGIGNSVATLPGILGNIISGVILDRIHASPESQGQAWSLVFGITAGFATLGAVVFMLTASAEQIDFDKRKRQRLAARQGRHATSP